MLNKSLDLTVGAMALAVTSLGCIDQGDDIGSLTDDVHSECLELLVRIDQGRAVVSFDGYEVGLNAGDETTISNCPQDNEPTFAEFLISVLEPATLIHFTPSNFPVLLEHFTGDNAFGCVTPDGSGVNLHVAGSTILPFVVTKSETCEDN